MLNIFYFSTSLCLLFAGCVPSDAKIIRTNPTLLDILKLTGKTVEDLPSDYETIQIWYPKDGASLEIPSKRYISFYAFGKNITTKLEPIQFNLMGENTPIWLADWNNGTFKLNRLPLSTVKREFSWYATSKRTVLGTGFDEGLPYFVGKVKHMSIVPLSEEESQELRRRKRDSELLPGVEDPTGRLVLSGYHKIYASSKEDSIDFFDIIKTDWEGQEEEEDEVENVIPLKRIKRGSMNRLKTIHLGIIPYADYGSQFIDPIGLLFNQHLMYLTAFWNNVNMYFQGLKDPSVSLHITGMIITKNDPDVPFFIKNHVGFRKIVSKESLIDMNEWFNFNDHIIPKHTYDVAITMTSRDLFQSSRQRKVAVDGAVLSSINSRERDFDKNITAIVRDSHDFSGILPTVEEIAHIMNVGYESPLLSEKNICNLYNGAVFYVQNSSYYLYSQTFEDMFWMPCENKPKCHFKEYSPNTGKPLPNILPGELVSLDEQCQLLGHQKSCKVHDNFDCNGFLWCEVKKLEDSLYLWTTEETDCMAVGSILDGTLCGVNKYCYNKQCVLYAQDVWIQNEPNDFGSLGK